MIEGKYKVQTGTLNKLVNGIVRKANRKIKKIQRQALSYT